jgi:hypothetical protein
MLMIELSSVVVTAGESPSSSFRITPFCPHGVFKCFLLSCKLTALGSEEGKVLGSGML